LIFTLWVVRYWHSADFGFYEDDLTHLPTAAAMSWSEVIAFAFDPSRIANLLGQGHPLHYTFIYLLTNLGWRLGGIHGLYWLGFCIEAANICLFYALLKRIGSQALGALGGLAYALYSADTTQAYLTYSLGLHPSLTLLLMAGHAYLSGKKWLSYPLAGAMLLTYETPFTVFLAFPLLNLRRQRKPLSDLMLHVLIVGLMLVAMVVWRTGVGDDRVGGLDLQQAVTVPIVHMIQGTLVSLGTYLYRPLQTLKSLDLEVAAVTILGFGLFSSLLYQLELGMPHELSESLRSSRVGLRHAWRSIAGWKKLWIGLPHEVRSLLRILAAGLVMLALAYPLTYTVRAYAISGRDTRVHSAGVVGAALALGSFLLLVLWLARTTRWRQWLNLGIGAWLGILAGYGFVIQRDYQAAWLNQQHFWSDLVIQIPDARDGTVVLVEPGPLGDVRQIGANTWNLVYVLEQLYEFPPDWDRSPRVVRLEPDWREHIFSGDGWLQLDWRTVLTPSDVWGEIEGKDVILFLDQGGVLVRQSGPMDIAGQSTSLMTTKERGEPPYPRRLLYDLLIRKKWPD
jgi:hypothetical protein